MYDLIFPIFPFNSTLCTYTEQTRIFLLFERGSEKIYGIFHIIIYTYFNFSQNFIEDSNEAFQNLVKGVGSRLRGNSINRILQLSVRRKIKESWRRVPRGSTLQNLRERSSGWLAIRLDKFINNSQTSVVSIDEDNPRSPPHDRLRFKLFGDNFLARSPPLLKPSLLKQSSLGRIFSK